MSEAKLVAEVRTGTGKGIARKARRAGLVPAIVYGSNVSPLAIQMDQAELQRLVASGGTGRLVDLQVGDEKQPVLLKEVQRDPVRGDIIHADFHKVRLDQEVSVTVPIVLTGETERTLDGGIIAVTLYELKVSCLPTQIPESIQVSTDGLAIGSTITVADLEIPEGITVQDEPELAVVSVVAPRVETEDAEVEDEAAEGEQPEEAADEAAEEE